ncbi:MAG: HAMP domain-containing histidine kinase, partial [Archangium sp.]|nr:HAMP domain-containing histidine kinase [Archangium sp.]
SAVHEVLGQATERLQAVRDSRERLLADAAHELRTPLSLMRTRLDLALRRERTSDELKTALFETREEVVRLAELAGRLLDTAAATRGPIVREPTDLHSLLNESVMASKPLAAQRQVTVVLEGPPAFVVSAHAVSIRQAVDNLLSNALKFAPDGSRVAVKLDRVGELVRIAVIDEGSGIPEAEREAIFEPFHRVRGGPPGTGLGLAIVREVARRHGGRAFVAPTSPGAEVVIEFPA